MVTCNQRQRSQGAPRVPCGVCLHDRQGRAKRQRDPRRVNSFVAIRRKLSRRCPPPLARGVFAPQESIESLDQLLQEEAARPEPARKKHCWDLGTGHDAGSSL